MLGVCCQAGEGDGGPVDAGGEEAAKEDFVEGGVGTACRIERPELISMLFVWKIRIGPLRDAEVALTRLVDRRA